MSLLDDESQIPLPLFKGKWYTRPDGDTPVKPLPLMANIELSVRTSLDLYVTDKLQCTPGDEEQNLLLLTERVLNMLRSRKGLGRVEIYTIDPDNPFDPVPAVQPAVQPAAEPEVERQVEVGQTEEAA